MKKYSFRLQTLMRVRQIFEDEAERLFRIALQQLTIAVEKLDDLRAELVKLNKDLAALRKRCIDVAIQLLYDRYIVRLRERTEEQAKIVAAAEDELERRREELIARIKDRKTVEELRLRDYDRYLQELRRFEQSVIDDIATLRGAGELSAALWSASS
ncbi:MAG TPA: flagellar export protein FliJ [Acidobacteriota bacterium]|nr:flagellar export protein FliJ [Acidobacteriota bacterium]